MKTIFCIDASGSVNGVTLYHNVTRTIFNKFYKNGDIIYLWGSSTSQKSEDEFRIWNNNKSAGLSGTASELIADIINQEKNSGLEHLIIITDGCVDTGSIDRSDEKMKNNNIYFKFVSTYIIGTNGDRSVGAPFCRGIPSTTYIYTSENNPKKLASLNKEEIKLFKDFENQIINYAQFEQKAIMLKRSIIYYSSLSEG